MGAADPLAHASDRINLGLSDSALYLVGHSQKPPEEADLRMRLARRLRRRGQDALPGTHGLADLRVARVRDLDGINTDHARRWERAASDPPLVNVFRLAQVAEIPVRFGVTTRKASLERQEPVGIH